MFFSNVRTGLPVERVDIHRAHYGGNKLPEPPKPTIWGMLWTQLTDFMILILLVVAIVDFALGEVAPAITLLVVVVVNASIGLYQEIKANRSLEALKSLSTPKVFLFYSTRGSLF
jgi:Ca2+-transporting ATPase